MRDALPATLLCLLCNNSKFRCKIMLWILTIMWSQWPPLRSFRSLNAIEPLKSWAAELKAFWKNGLSQRILWYPQFWNVKRILQGRFVKVLPNIFRFVFTCKSTMLYGVSLYKSSRVIWTNKAPIMKYKKKITGGYGHQNQSSASHLL